MPVIINGDAASTQPYNPEIVRPKCTNDNANIVAGGNRIIDIRRDQKQQSLQKAIIDGLNPGKGVQKTLPTLVLYDEAGLKLFEQITYLEEYYLTNAEIEVLETHADQIARALQPGSIILELGSGNLRKVNILLRAIDRRAENVDYYALDLSRPELERTLAEVPKGTYNNVRCYGLHGTYDDGLEWLQTPEIKAKTKAIIWLGSSIGNLSRDEAADFLLSFTGALQPSDAMLVGVDSCKDPAKVYHAYNDREGVTQRFYENGLLNANNLLGQEVFDLDKWHILGEYNHDEGRHETFVVPNMDLIFDQITVRCGEKIKFEVAYKYNPEDLLRLWQRAAVRQMDSWYNANRDYALHMITNNRFAISGDPDIYASQPVPTWHEWTQLWHLWDAATRRMLKDEELLEKPIKLRNACVFYLGHIPTFIDMKLTDATNGLSTPPDYFPKIFERGIDPDVDNPEQCHAHSEIPDEWPPLNEILAFQDRVRIRVQRLYDSGEAQNPKVARTLWLGYEHEAMHLETFLYMLVQSDKTLPPPSVAVPNFELLAKIAEEQAVTNEWFVIPEMELLTGLDDPETDSGPQRHFGWDIEKPCRKVSVKSFQASARPITNGDYADYMRQNGLNDIPASWIKKSSTANGVQKHASNGSTVHTTDALHTSYSVRTVYGPVPLHLARTWPVAASFDELKGCAAWMGGRIPTFEEVRSLYDYVSRSNKDPAQKAIGSKIPAVNGHLVNNGVEETPPNGSSVIAAGVVKDSVSSGEATNGHTTEPGRLGSCGLFANLSGCNVGFKNWHPMPVTQNGGRLSGQGDFGGLWEWTSTPLSRHEGYSEMPLYPAYSSDFFDGKHNIILGGSWATVPRIAGRKSFTNWYQRNYLYPFAGARVVKDISA